MFQDGPKWLQARPEACQKSVQLWPYHASKSTLHQETNGGRYVH